MSDMIGTHAMVMAAGLGLRMRPLTEHTPKPLIKVAGKALVDHTIDWMLACAIEQLVVNSHYLSEQLEAHIATRRDPRIRMSHEEVLLETGGGITKALPYLGNAPFFAANSDTICVDGQHSALQRMRGAWREYIDVLLLLHPVEKAIGYGGAGDFFLENDLPLRRGSSASAPYVFTGVQLLHPRLFNEAPSGAFSMNLLYDRALSSGRIRGLVHEGDWLHVGDPEGLRLANHYF